MFPYPPTCPPYTNNEEKMVGEVVQGCKPFADQVIVVDGRSQDRTPEMARKAGAEVIIDEGRGKGAAIRSAIPYIKGDIVVFLDADGSHDPQDIPKLIQPILQGEADHVSGSRLIGGSSELHGTFDEFFRLMGSSRCVGPCSSWMTAGAKKLTIDGKESAPITRMRTTTPIMALVCGVFRVVAPQNVS